MEGETESSLFRVTLHAVDVGDIVGNATKIGGFSGRLITGFTVLPGGALVTATPSTQVDETAAEVTITVERLGETLVPTSVAFQTIDRTAIAGMDYVSTAGVLNFDKGETSLNIVVPLLSDDASEGTEAFALELGQALGGAMTLIEGHTVEILDDDATGGGGGPSGSGGDSGCNFTASSNSKLSLGFVAALLLNIIILAVRRFRFIS